MSIAIERFDEYFETLWGYAPFPWQSRLAKKVFSEGWPDCIDLPTASGKTTAIDIAVFTLACQASLPVEKHTVGRRIYFTVNRRVIVDEAFDRAKKLAKKLITAEEDNDPGILGEVARALRSLNEEQDKCKAPPLDIVQLRGGIYRDRAWARSITQPIIVCTTADQLGSRLLFRGYGVSPASAPIHAALTACDSLILLDEAHVTKAFSQTLGLLNRYRQLDKTSPPMRYVQMTATPANDVPEEKRFDLKKENWDDPRNQKLRDRRDALKPATLVPLGKSKSIVGKVVELAMKAQSGPRKAIGIIVNRVQTARNIEAGIRAALSKEKIDADVHLVIGRMRPIDRDTLQDQLRKIVGPDRPEVLEKSVFVVATQCLEVGADYDFDALITECASIDALRQRFGRLNRKGRKKPDGTPIDAVAYIVTNDESIKGDNPIYSDAIKHTWDWLWSKKDDKNSVDFGIGAFKSMWEEVQREHATYLDEKCPKPLLAPAPNAAVLLPAHLDALCQTAPQPVPSPDVSYFIHGPQRDNAEVNVCWRADFGDDNSLWPEIVRLLPPTSPECMTVPITAVRKWMGQSYTNEAEADVPTATPEESDGKEQQSTWRELKSIRVVAWRGWKDVEVLTSPNAVRPNATIVIRTQDFGWESLGHIPGAPVRSAYEQGEKETAEEHKLRCEALDRRRDAVDKAEQSKRQASRRVVIRRHSAIPRNIDITGDLSADDLRGKFKQLSEFTVKEFLDRKFDWSSKFKRRPYPGVDEDSTVELIVFDEMLRANALDLPAEEDEGIDNSTDAAGPITLVEHTRHVVDRLDGVAKLIHGIDVPTFRHSVQLHDIGKADLRFNAMLRRCTPGEVLERGGLLGKSDQLDLTKREFAQVCEQAMFPRGFNHEMLSIELIENAKMPLGAAVKRELLLHLIAAHHGHARPFAPVVFDEPTDDEQRSKNLANYHGRRSVELEATGYWPAIKVTGQQRADETNWPPAHRLDSNVAERFWTLTRDHGWWGLAYLESILRLADQQASAAEQKETPNE